MTSLHAFPPGAVSPIPSEVSSPPVIPPSGGASSPANPSGNSPSRRPWREWLPSSLQLRSPKAGTSKSKSEIEWEHTRARIGETVSLLIEAAGEHTSAETSPVVSIPGFLATVKVLDNILNSVDGVQTNRWACLRLTERCANMLLAIHETVLESGSEVAQELTPALNRIGRCFWDFEHFLKEQVQISFLFQYLKKDEILREIGRHDTAVGDCIALFHGAMPRILKGMLKTSAQATSLLLATDPNPPSHVSNETLEPLDLAQLESEFLANGLPRDETSSLHETLRLVQDKENATDRARDMEDLGRVLHRALNATSHLAVTRILQIAKPDMPAAIMVLLRELERQQQSGNTGRAAESHSPRVRALTWPLDGVPAKQVSLLHMQFLELDLEAFKKTRQNSEMDIEVNVADSPSPLISGTVRRRAGSYTGARLRVPSGSDLSTSEYSGTALDTPQPSYNGQFLLAEPPSFKLDSELGSPSPDESTADDLDLDLDPVLDRPSNSFEAATELRYRMSLSHAFHHLSVSVPLWTPSVVKVGAVGYLSKPTGEFRTLFTCDNPSGTSGGRVSASEIPPLVGCTVATQRQSRSGQHGQGMKARGMKIMDKLGAATTPALGIKRTYEIAAFGETAHLIAEKAEYRYFQHLDGPRRWFRANVEAIMNIYHRECLKEELFLVFGALNARDHALFVNHGYAEEPLETRFHVSATRKPGKPWGHFEFGRGDGLVSATPHPETMVFKVSEVGPSRNTDTVLLSRLRFRLDELEPTTQ